MKYTILPIAAVLYSLYSAICYMPEIKNNKSFIHIGLILALVSNVLWLVLAYNTKQASEVLFMALIWDSIVVLTAVVIPLVFFNIQLTPISTFGIVLVVAGLLLVKIGTVR
jgi:multidrug transporter EmrE-like cation transporter